MLEANSGVGNEVIPSAQWRLDRVRKRSVPGIIARFASQLPRLTAVLPLRKRVSSLTEGN